MVGCCRVVLMCWLCAGKRLGLGDVVREHLHAVALVDELKAVMALGINLLILDDRMPLRDQGRVSAVDGSRKFSKA